MLYVPTERLVYKVVYANELGGVQGGDWDLNRVLLSETAKHKSMFQRFVEKRKWEETDLFKDVYPRRFESGLAFRGSFDLKVVARHYYRKIDRLFQSLRQRGFKPLNPPYVLIGRDGEPMLGIQGNHRVAMAKILKIKEIPCAVVCRHADARSHFV